MADTLSLADARLRFARPTLPPSAIELVGNSPAATRLQELVRRAASIDAGVLITAETGVAVESIAQELHARGRRVGGPFVAVDCDGGDPSRVDALLFGSPDAAVETDLEPVSADSRIAAARGGTLFLRDIAQLPANAQAKLARVVRDGEVRIDGVPVATAWRMIASAAPSIDTEVQGNRLRTDLYRRLAAVRIDLPPLRDRAEDVPAIATRLLDEIGEAHGGGTRTFTNAALALVGALAWPGNVAELRHVLERVVADSADGTIQVEHLLPALRLDARPPAFRPAPNLREARLRFERDYIAAVLQHHGWRMAEAAQTLGIQRPNLYRKARQLGIPLSRVSD
ncbi:MAG TPA: sigma 54-interacting transcriptional regulator [Vicinamibacterales bacterium]|nr:sigma 54-interacting transcriptional regulator [Vicinamibacterales bacterium]